MSGGRAGGHARWPRLGDGSRCAIVGRTGGQPARLHTRTPQAEACARRPGGGEGGVEAYLRVLQPAAVAHDRSPRADEALRLDRRLAQVDEVAVLRDALPVRLQERRCARLDERLAHDARLVSADPALHRARGREQPVERDARDAPALGCLDHARRVQPAVLGAREEAAREPLCDGVARAHCGVRAARCDRAVALLDDEARLPERLLRERGGARGGSNGTERGHGAREEKAGGARSAGRAETRRERGSLSTAASDGGVHRGGCHLRHSAPPTEGRLAGSTRRARPRQSPPKLWALRPPRARTLRRSVSFSWTRGLKKTLVCACQ